MATNVTEKDKTLNEIIDWAKSRCHEAALSRFDVRRKSDRDFYDGQVNAFHEMLELCRSKLGYSGSMPSEVPNQSEDAKKMKWKPDWSDIAENLLIGLMAVAAAAIFIVFCVCIWKAVTTERTIIMRDGSQSYACTISDISPTPFDCKPIEDTEE